MVDSQVLKLKQTEPPHVPPEKCVRLSTQWKAGSPDSDSNLFPIPFSLPSPMNYRDYKGGSMVQ